MFLVGLEGEKPLLNEIDYALQHPVFPLFLGRRSCPPEGKLSLGIRSGKNLLQALEGEPWLVSDWLKNKDDENIRLHIITDAYINTNSGYLQRDLPISFDQSHRKFGFRRVIELDSVLHNNSSNQFTTSEGFTDHDPMLELEE